MTFEKVLEKRKSTRKFTGEPIDKKLVEEAIAWGKKAPSAGAVRAYDFVAVTNREKIEKLARYANQGWIKKAGLVLVICIDPEKSAKRYGDRGRNLYCIQDATLFGSHIDLFFVSKSLATCWVGSFHQNPIVRLLGLKHTPISFLVVGHRQERA